MAKLSWWPMAAELPLPRNVKTWFWERLNKLDKGDIYDSPSYMTSCVPLLSWHSIYYIHAYRQWIIFESAGSSISLTQTEHHRLEVDLLHILKLIRHFDYVILNAVYIPSTVSFQSVLFLWGSGEITQSLLETYPGICSYFHFRHFPQEKNWT